MRLEVRLQQHLARGHGPRPPSLRSNGFVDDEVAAIALLAVLLATQGPHCRQRRAKRLDIDPPYLLRRCGAVVIPSMACNKWPSEEAKPASWLYARHSRVFVTPHHHHHPYKLFPRLGLATSEGRSRDHPCTGSVLSSILKSHRRLGAR